MKADQPLTLGKTLKSQRMNKRDEEQQVLVSFRSL